MRWSRSWGISPRPDSCLPDSRPGVELIDGQFVGTAIEEGVFEVVLQICDGGSPPECTLSTVTYVVEELPYTGAYSQEQFLVAISLITVGWLLVAIAGRRERDRRGTVPSSS